MQASALILVTVGTLLALASGCGKSNDEPAAAGNAGKIDVGSAGAGAGTAGAGAGTAGAGAGTAGAGAGTAGAGAGTAGAGAGTAGASAGSSSGGSGAGLLDCDPGKVLCKRAAPECVFGEVPQVVENCFGECVKVDRCACSTAAHCPQPEQYTCWSKRHCGPFVH